MDSHPNTHPLRTYTHADHDTHEVVVLLDDVLIRLNAEGARELARDIEETAVEVAARFGSSAASSVKPST